jgi:hypothetical protein
VRTTRGGADLIGADSCPISSCTAKEVTKDEQIQVPCYPGALPSDALGTGSQRRLTTDLWYMVWYLTKLPARPHGEQIEQMLALALTGAAVIALLATTTPICPTDGLHHVPSEDRFKTTRNRIRAEPVPTPLLLYQDYHLVHQ